MRYRSRSRRSSHPAEQPSRIALICHQLSRCYNRDSRFVPISYARLTRASRLCNARNHLSRVVTGGLQCTHCRRTGTIRQWAAFQNLRNRTQEGDDAARNRLRIYRRECNTITVRRNSFPVIQGGYIDPLRVFYPPALAILREAAGYRVPAGRGREAAPSGSDAGTSSPCSCASMRICNSRASGPGTI